MRTVCCKCFTDLFIVGDSTGIVRIIQCELSSDSAVFRHLAHPVEIELDFVTALEHPGTTVSEKCCGAPRVDYDLFLRAATSAHWPTDTSFMTAQLALGPTEGQRDFYLPMMGREMRVFFERTLIHCEGGITRLPDIPKHERRYYLWKGLPTNPKHGEEQMLVGVRR